MRTIICFILLVASISAQTRSTWVTFAPKGAGFSVSVPGKPAGRTIKRPTYTSHMFTIKVGDAMFGINYGEFEASDPDFQAGLVANRDKMIEGFRGRLISSREITVDGYTGIEFTCESILGNVRGQLFQIGNRIFQMIAIVNGKGETRNVNRFFNSLKFTAVN